MRWRTTGNTKDGNARACVMLLEITASDVEVEFLRVRYDVDKAAAAIASSGLPPYFAEKLKEAR